MSRKSGETVKSVTAITFTQEKSPLNMMDQVMGHLDQIRTRVGGGSNVVFLLMAHFFFSAWTDLRVWHGSNLTTVNTLLLLSLAWTLHNRISTAPVFCSLMIECFGILNDIIVLALFFPSGQWSSTMKFSAVMAIFNLIVRFWGILLLSGEYSVRGDGGAVPDGNGNKLGGGGGDAASVVGGGSTVYGAAYPPIYSTNPAPAPPSTIGGGGGISSRPGSSASGYGYSQTPYQGALPIKKDPLPELPTSYKQHS